MYANYVFICFVIALLPKIYNLMIIKCTSIRCGISVLASIFNNVLFWTSTRWTFINRYKWHIEVDFSSRFIILLIFSFISILKFQFHLFKKFTSELFAIAKCFHD